MGKLKILMLKSGPGKKRLTVAGIFNSVVGGPGRCKGIGRKSCRLKKEEA